MAVADLHDRPAKQEKGKKLPLVARQRCLPPAAAAASALRPLVAPVAPPREAAAAVRNEPDRALLLPVLLLAVLIPALVMAVPPHPLLLLVTAAAVDQLAPPASRPIPMHRRPPAAAAAAATASATNLDQEFIAMFRNPSLTTATGQITNTTIQTKFGPSRISDLAATINSLTSRGRLTMSRHTTTGELLYNLVSESQASKFEGLDMSARLVYQIIEKAGNMGIWTKDIRTQSNIQQLALNKIFKALESSPTHQTHQERHRQGQEALHALRSDARQGNYRRTVVYRTGI